MTRAALLLPALALGSGPLAAAGHVGLAGSEVSRLGSYTYVGIISPLGNGKLGDGLVMRHWLEYLTYEYETGGRDVDAERFGYAPALGYQTRLWGGYAGFYGGLRLAHTDLDPNDRDNKDEGNTARFFLQADALTPVGRNAENQLVAELETRYSGYYVRERLMFRLGASLMLGPEAVVKGGEDYDGWQAGLALGGIRVMPGLTLTLRGGVSGQRDQSNSGYAGLEFVMSM